MLNWTLTSSVSSGCYQLISCIGTFFHLDLTVPAFIYLFTYLFVYLILFVYFWCVHLFNYSLMYPFICWFVYSFGWNPTRRELLNDCCLISFIKKQGLSLHARNVSLARSCGDPGDIPQGRHEGDCHAFSCRVTYSCYPGFDLVGRANRYCQADGTWTPQELPICVRKSIGVKRCQAASCGVTAGLHWALLAPNSTV